MKRYGNLYDKIYDIENIKLAHKNARKGKTHYKEVVMVDEDIDRYAGEIQTMLMDKTFVNGEYTTFMKKDKGKMREISKLPYYPDRIVHHAVMQVLEPIWKKTLIRTTYQSIKGRGVHKAMTDVQYFIRKHKPRYCVKVDIRKYYPSIDNKILKQVIRKKIKCKDTLWLLDSVVNSRVGVPIGNYLSQYFGNLYLNELDHLMKEEHGVKGYFRYCDDIILLVNSKSEAHRLLAEIRMYAKTNRLLEVKRNYQVIDVLDRGVDFVGYRMFDSYTLVRTFVATRFKRTDDELALPSYLGMLKWANTNNLIRSKGLR